MGRRPDRPEDQEAKGYPGKRKSKVERLIEAAEARARLLAAAPGETSHPLAPPAFIKDPLLADALLVWREKAPVLHERNLYDPTLDRETLAIYCVYVAEYVSAEMDILKNGHERLVKTVSGDKMPRQRFAVHRRDIAAKRIFDLSEKFGLTPLDRMRIERIDSMREADLFNRTHHPEPREEVAEQQAAAAGEDDPIGMLDRLDSPPPGFRPN